MLNKPRLRYCYHAELLDDEILLLSEKENHLISSRLYNLVLSNIIKDGVSTKELVSRLEGEISAAEVLYALNILKKEGYITESTESISSETCAYWNSMNMDVTSLIEVFKNKPISVESIGSVQKNLFIKAFETSGMEIKGEGVLKVILTDGYERDELRKINREAIAGKQPWMLVKPVGVELWIGPMFSPGKTGCFECLLQRLRNNHLMNTFYKACRNTEDRPPIPVSLSPMSLRIAANMSSIEIVKWLYFGENDNIEGKIVSFDTLAASTTSHVLIKRPQCKVCGEVLHEVRDPYPVIVAKKASYCISRQGGYREATPEDTIEKYKHHVSPITGVVQTLVPFLSDKESPVHNYCSGYNIAVKCESPLWLNHRMRSCTAGKGKTWSQAKAGALCEAIERYSCTYQGDEPFTFTSLEKLGEKGIHPNECMNYSDKQYQNRDRINKESSHFLNMIPEPFDESLEMHWTPVYSLTEHIFKYLPSCFCYSQYPVDDDSRLFCYPDSNGNAAGNSMEEAILQGFLELVERDSVALWWYGMLRKPAVDLPSFEDPYFMLLMDYYESLHRSLYVLDLTTDLRIPAFAAISHRLGTGKQDIVFAFGAHVEAKIAIERALTELNQFLPVAEVVKKDSARRRCNTRNDGFLNWLGSATLENQPYLAPSKKVTIKKATDYPVLCKPNIYDSIMFCIDTATDHKLETLVIDMTRPDIRLNVVKVIVPGLRHFWKRLAPGRLYDIPVKMGWLNTPLEEEELNPIGVFM